MRIYIIYIYNTIYIYIKCIDVMERKESNHHSSFRHANGAVRCVCVCVFAATPSVNHRAFIHDCVAGSTNTLHVRVRSNSTDIFVTFQTTI